jgi:6-phosphogluconolactonase
MLILYVLLSIVPVASGFLSPSSAILPCRIQPYCRQPSFTIATMLRGTAPAATDSIRILPDADAVGATVRDIVESAAKKAISERGHFALAIPGGSILKMLIGCNGDWTSQTTVVYVNHKCVPMDDMDLSTHAKAGKYFLSDWKGCNVIVLDGTDDGQAEASSYVAKMQSLSKDILPISAEGFPVFDLALVGVGDDGHIGSLYPNRDEVLRTDAWVLPVEMKKPPSITLSLPVIMAARDVVVAACGVSDKYPQGKSDGMRRAIVDPNETPATFPASSLRPIATWILDEAAASKLS